MRIITATAEQKGISKICPGGVSPRPATQSSGKQSPKNIWKIRDRVSVSDTVAGEYLTSRSRVKINNTNCKHILDPQVWKSATDFRITTYNQYV